MVNAVTPALEAFASQIECELVWGEVWLRRTKSGFEARHEADRAAEAGSLKRVEVRGLRALAQWTATGGFRPLKSAPNLQRGWLATIRGVEELGLALNHLHPGSVVDWHAARSASPPVTHYREFTARQTGMYRITTMLDDDKAASMTRACCDRRFCLKRRRWTVGGLEPDAAAEKSLIPCLEPCAMLLEFARAIVRFEQATEAAGGGRLPVEEAGRIAALRDRLLAEGFKPDRREADFSDPENPRRLQYLIERANASAR